MNSFADNSLRQFLESRPDLFGNEACYLGFEIEQQYPVRFSCKHTITFGRIIYQKGKEKYKSTSLVIKHLPPRVKIYSDAETFHTMNESFFYTHLLPFFNSYRNISSLFPEFYDGSIRVNVFKKEALMIFENIYVNGFRVAEKASFLDYEHLSLMLRKLGNFHSYSFKAKKEDSIRFRTLCDLFISTSVPGVKKFLFYSTAMQENGIRNLQKHPQYFRRISNVERFHKMAAEFVKQLLTNDKNNPTSVLCHGFYGQPNIMFKYENGKPVDLKMVDMTACVLASPVVDIAVVLYCHADQEMRNKHWDDLIDEYYSGLSEYFEDVELPTREDIMLQFRGKAFWGYHVAACRLHHFVAEDNNWETIKDRLPSKYYDLCFEDIPHNEFNAICGTTSSESTAALTNILKDMMDREFI